MCDHSARFSFVSLNSITFSFMYPILVANTYINPLMTLESPINPFLKLADISAISEIAHKSNVPVAVDNTFASPYFQNPLDLGSDIVIHSTTKYINGHSDSIGGAVMVNNQELKEQFKFDQNAICSMLSPFGSYLVMRGIRALGVRIKQHAENAMKIAEYLESQKWVKKFSTRVFHPTPSMIWQRGR